MLQINNLRSVNDETSDVVKAFEEPGAQFPSSVIPKDFKKWHPQLSLLSAQHKKDSVENKQASFLVVSLGKALNRLPRSLCGKQIPGPCSILIVVTQSN